MAVITEPMLLDTTGKEMVRAMGKQNALLQILARDSMKALADDWSDVQKIVRGGSAADIFDFGDQFVDEWTDKTPGSEKKYEYPWQVNHFGQIELEDGETINGMYIQAHYAHPFGVQFSQRAFLACPDGLAAGTYYFTISGKWGTYVLDGDIVSFTLTKDVPEGGRVAGCFRAPDVEKSTWKIYSYSADGKSVLETVTPIFEAAGTDLGIMKHNTRNGNLNSVQEMAYGWNRWKTSALRQYLNSDAAAGEWWTAQDEWDIAPDQLKTKPGFLTGVPADLLAVVKKAKVVTYTNTVQDGGTADITYDSFFIPSLEEIHAQPQIKGEGEVHEYWKRASESSEPLKQYGTYPQMRTFAVENHTSPQLVRLRSAYRGNACYTWYVFASGYVYHYHAYWAYRCAPACRIG